MHAAISQEMFQSLQHISTEIYQVELVKIQIELEEQTFVRPFIVQYANLRNLETFYKFSQRFSILSSRRKKAWISIHCV